jgi:unsaturated rhamnogalacturonyl hydrolase
MKRRKGVAFLSFHIRKKIGLWVLTGFIFILLFCVRSPGQEQTTVVAQNSLYSIRMAESVMSRHPNGYSGWDYVTGTVLKAFENLWLRTGDSLYYQYIKNTVDLAVTSNGTIRGYNLSDYNLDEINEGRMVLFLYKQTGEEKYMKAAQLLRSQLLTHPRTSEGGFWHKQRYPHQMWLDGLYMGSPFYAEYGIVFNEPADLDDVVTQLTLMENHAREPVTGLLYHGWDESKTQPWADPVTGCSPSFWGRAIGWYAMALVDVLDYLPEDHPQRQNIIAIFQRLSEAVLKVQDDSSGVWWQVVDQGGREGNYLESSVSCMLTYALAKGIRLGYINRAYLPAVEKAYQGILKEFVSENTDGTINLDQTCITAGLGNGRDGSYEYYVYQEGRRSNDGKGVGPFINASLEMEMATTGVKRISSPTTHALALSIYPNPFNPATTITFTLPHKANVKIAVYNLLGEQVTWLVDEVMPAGSHSVSLDASNMSSGMYVCRLVAGADTLTRSMIVLK